MRIDFLPFQLGMQYENWEFDLEFEKDYNTCEMYKYIKQDFVALLGLPLEEIYLYFNLDILVRVDLRFHTGKIPYVFIDLSEKLEAKYGKQILNSNDEKSTLFKSWRDIKKSLTLHHYLDINEINIVITKHKYEEF